MATTQYLHLNKPTGNDLVNPLTDTFPNWDLVDTAYHELDSRAIGRATEVVSQGVHAITLLDTDCKTFKFVATGNYSAGETFTVNGIQANAYTPSGSALVSNAFVTGSIVLGTLNEDGTTITFYVTGSAVADDSLKLGGELPSYYATQSDMTSANTDITNLKNQAGNTSIVGIGDGTLSGAVSSLNNDLTNVLEWKTLKNNQLIKQNETFTKTSQQIIHDIAFEFIGISGYPDIIFVGSVVNGVFFAMNILPNNPYGQNYMYHGAIKGTINGNTITINDFKWDTTVSTTQRTLTGNVYYR